MNLRKFIVILHLISIAVLFSGCSKENNAVEEKASEVINVFSTGDINKINEFMLSSDKVEMNQELAAEFGFAGNSKQNNGVLEQIFKRTSIEIEDVEKETITYKVTAPHMTDLFSDIQKIEATLRADNFEDYLSEYIEEAKLSETTVKVPYTMEDGEFNADYKSQEFINSITGGLFESYKGIYQEMLNDYSNGLEE